MQYRRAVAEQPLRQRAESLKGKRRAIASTKLNFHPTFRRYQSLRRNVDGPGTRAILRSELSRHSHGVPQSEGCFNGLRERHPADFDARKEPIAEMIQIAFFY